MAAQYDDPPSYPVTMICSGIDGAPEGSDVLSRIFAGVVALRGNMSCYSINAAGFSIQTVGDTNSPDLSVETVEGWAWQVTL